MERDAAVRIVEEHLEREHQEQQAAGIDAIRVVVMKVEEHELVWVVSCQSQEYARTRSPEQMLVGGGPYLVDRVDGGLHEVGAVSWRTGEWEDDYRVRIRGLTVHTAVDDLHDEIRDVASARGRIHAMHILRQRLPMLTLAQIVEYVTALQHGDAPAPLAAVAAEALVPPLNPVLAVKTIHSAEDRLKH